MKRRPIRIQGTREGANITYVGPGSRWANPCLLTDVFRRFPGLTTEQCAGMALNEFRDLIGWWRLAGISFAPPVDLDADRHIRRSMPSPERDGTRYMQDLHYPSINEIRSSLRGQDLSCTCPLDEPCHVDALLVVANSTGGSVPT